MEEFMFNDEIDLEKLDNGMSIMDKNEYLKSLKKSKTINNNLNKAEIKYLERCWNLPAYKKGV